MNDCIDIKILADTNKPIIGLYIYMIWLKITKNWANLNLYKTLKTKNQSFQMLKSEFMDHSIIMCGSTENGYSF